jgi:lipid-binding SYLF domain-containing protein
MSEKPMPAGQLRRRRIVRLVAALAAVPLLPACTGAFSTEPMRARERRDVDMNVEATLVRCYQLAPDTRELVARAAGVLVFPTVVPVNPVTGEWAGRGELREGRVVTNYYLLSTSVDPASKASRQGAARAIIFVFTDRDALNRFRLSQVWRANEAAAAAEKAAETSGVLRAGPAGIVTLVLQGRQLVTNPSMPEALVVPLGL